MLEKTMKLILNKKVNAWLKSIKDDKIKEIIKENLIITGGCFTSMILNEDINDYDCYLRTKEACRAVAEYYVDIWNNKQSTENSKKALVLTEDYDSDRYICDPDRIKIIFPSAGEVGTAPAATSLLSDVDSVSMEEHKKENKDNVVLFLSSNAITLNNNIQIVIRFYGEPETIHKNYDFAHTKAYWTARENEIHISKEVYETTINKTLLYTGSLYPVCSLFRLRKFIHRGWFINAGQILKIAMQIGDLNLRDAVVLEDQLIGVDSLYFTILLDKFREAQKNNIEKQIDSDYIMSLVDEIF